MLGPVPYIIDTTLRDGEQAPGVVFHLDDKLRISRVLDEVGIPEVEIGTPIIGPQEIADLRVLTHSGFHFKSLVWCRAIKADIDAAVKTEAQGVNISFPISDIHLSAMNKSHDWVFETLYEIVNYARQHFEYIVIGAQDASRAKESFLLEFLGAIQAYKVERVRIADTVGILNPISTRALFKKIKKAHPTMSFEFHGHNDLGMATANTIAALLSGAEGASVTVNGLGERAGNAALEEVVMALELSCGIRTELKTSLFGKLSEIVSLASDIGLSNQKPIVGCDVLHHETGKHTNLILKNRATYQIIEANRIGKKEMEFIFGKHTGSASVKEYCLKHAIELPDYMYGEITSMLKEKSVLFKRCLSSEELLRTIGDVVERLSLEKNSFAHQ